MPEKKQQKRKSIFSSLFVPMIVIMIFQALLFYVTAVYGGIQESLSQNAADILSERLFARKNELESRLNDRWTELDGCTLFINDLYSSFEDEYGDMPFENDPEVQILFLDACSDVLISTLRRNETNGIYLILNDSSDRETALTPDRELYGLSIRDMDQDSNYTGREDLLLERAPSRLVESLGCQLDSWWEAKFRFDSTDDGARYYAPLGAAFDGISDSSPYLAYFSSAYQASGSDPAVASYSIPLMNADGYPYAVLGIEISAKYIASLLPSSELGDHDSCCYLLAQNDVGSNELIPIAASGSLYQRCFGSAESIFRGSDESTGGFRIDGLDGSKLYADSEILKIYNNNSPFENTRLVLVSMVERESLFSYIGRVKTTLMFVSAMSLVIGVAALAIVSRRFAKPITALAARVRSMDGYGRSKLGRLGIDEIDQLVDSIEELNLDVSRNSARTEFFSRMSHDMRTPMNAIISFSSPEMLENASERTKDEYLEKIHDSGVYLLGLINEVLDMTKIENNKTEIRRAPALAVELFDATLPMIEKLAQSRRIDLSSSIDIPNDLTVLADVQHINQIVMNLLSNAVKFTPEGGQVRFSASTEHSDDKCVLAIAISDTGIGMSNEFMKTLYTPFIRENDVREGSGLGLPIAKKLTELMNGAIACQSRQGVGTTFTVTLPLEECEAISDTAATGEVTYQEDMARLAGKRVLVCEDNKINTIIITKLLERVGLIVDPVENGSLGVSAFENSPPGYYCAIFMDVRMPVMNGHDASRAIRKLPRDDAQTIPIFAMTADAFVEDAEVSLKAGMSAHLSKPIEPLKLYAAMLKFIKD